MLQAKAAKIYNKLGIRMLQTSQSKLRSGELRGAIASILQEEGHLYISGSGVSSHAEFRDVVRCSVIPGPIRNYEGGTDERTSFGDDNEIVDVGLDPPHLNLPQHTEMAYLPQQSQPRYIAFGCLLPSQTGGNTPIADVASVTQELGHEFVSKITTKGVLQHRRLEDASQANGSVLNYNTWQNWLGVQTRKEAEQIMDARVEGTEYNFVDYSWDESGHLRTREFCTGIRQIDGMDLAISPLYGSHGLIWFRNYAPWDVFAPADRPLHTTWGDGEELTTEEILKLDDAHRKHERETEWEAGDILVVDNWRFTHARRPFQGPRKIVVAMSQSTQG